MLFSGFLESFIVVSAAPACVLDSLADVVKVNHFVKQGSTQFFKGPGQMFSAHVDFIETAVLGFIILGFPRFPCCTPAISPGRGIRGNGNHGRFQRPGKELQVELLEQAFQRGNSGTKAFFCHCRSSPFIDIELLQLLFKGASRFKP